MALSHYLTNFIVMNWFPVSSIYFHYPRYNHLVTWYSSDGVNKNQINYIFIKAHQASCIVNCHAYCGAETRSDHVQGEQDAHSVPKNVILQDSSIKPLKILFVFSCLTDLAPLKPFSQMMSLLRICGSPSKAALYKWPLRLLVLQKDVQKIEFQTWQLILQMVKPPCCVWSNNNHHLYWESACSTRASMHHLLVTQENCTVSLDQHKIVWEYWDALQSTRRNHLKSWTLTTSEKSFNCLT